MVKPRRPRGSSLVEVGLVMTLTLTLMTLMSLYFVRGQRYAAETEAYSSVQRAANNLLRQMTDDIRRSAEEIHVSSGCVIFLSFAPIAEEEPGTGLQLEPGTGKILWKKWIGYYHDAAQETLFRAEDPLDDQLTDPSTAPEVDPVLFRTAPEISRRALPGKVRAFSASGSGPRLIKLRLTTRGRSPISGASEAQREIEVTVATEAAVLN